MFDIRKIQEEVIYDAVKEESDENTAKEIIYGPNDSAKAESDADWVKSTMRRLETKFDSKTVKRIRMNCQCGHGMEERLSFITTLISSATSMEEFANSDAAKAAGLFCEGGELFLKFGFCPCPILAQVDKLETNTWCQCTTGYSKVLFEMAFNCDVDVELLKSVKMGDDRCLMKITPLDFVWKK